MDKQEQEKTAPQILFLKSNRTGRCDGHEVLQANYVPFDFGLAIGQAMSPRPTQR